MNATPETNRAVYASDGQWSLVLRDTCARMERERDEARRLCEAYRDNGLVGGRFPWESPSMCPAGSNEEESE